MPWFFDPLRQVWAYHPGPDQTTATVASNYWFQNYQNATSSTRTALGATFGTNLIQPYGLMPYNQQDAGNWQVLQAASNSIYSNQMQEAARQRSLEETMELAAPAIIRHREGRRPPRHREREEEALEVRRVEDALDGVIGADDRSRRLLLEHLDDDQREEYRSKNYITVFGASGQQYRIECYNYSVNIVVVGHRSRLCAHLGREIPIFDHFLAQKLMLEHDEAAFLRIANRHGP